MSRDVEVRIDGLGQLRRDLRKLGDNLADLKDANATVAGMVAAEAARRAPRRSGRLAGTLRGNRAAGGAAVMAGRAAVPYAGPIHWGWPARGIAAQPFAADAARALQPAWLAVYDRAIGAELDKLRPVY